MNAHSYTLKYNHRHLQYHLASVSNLTLTLLSLQVNVRLLSLDVSVGLLSLAVNVRLTWLMCYLLIYLRPLLLNEPFVVTVDTSVRVTMELLLLPMQRSIRSVSMEASLLDSKHVTICTAGPCQRSVSRVLVPWDLRPYFTVSHLRLPFSSPPTTRRVTVEVFVPASTRGCWLRNSSFSYKPSIGQAENTACFLFSGNGSTRRNTLACILCRENVFTAPVPSNKRRDTLYRAFTLATIRGIHIHSDWWEGFMKYSAEMG
jgi:hypothetical protein